MSDLLHALRAAVRPPPAPPAPPMATTPPAPPSEAASGASRRLSVGEWLAPGSAPGSWGVLMPGCNHPHEADAIVTMSESTPQGVRFYPVGLLRRRLHPVAPHDDDAQFLRPVPRYELLSTHGRDYLTAPTAECLLEELARRIGGCSIARSDG